MTTNTYTDHDYRMMALAAGYSIYGLHGVYYHKDVDPETKLLIEWNPTQGQDFINLIADARIDIEWSGDQECVHATYWNPDTNDLLTSNKQKVSDYPPPADAMIAAVLSCAIKKGEAILKEKGDDK